MVEATAVDLRAIEHFDLTLSEEANKLESCQSRLFASLTENTFRSGLIGTERPGWDLNSGFWKIDMLEN